MKKIFVFIVLLFIPFFINAKEYCSVVNGDVNTIGSEVVCGDEHFYVFESKENSVRLLSKYNLDVGYVYDKIILTESRFDELSDACVDSFSFFECEEFTKSKEYTDAISKYDSDKYVVRGYELDVNDVVNDQNETVYEVFFQVYINLTDLKQNPTAVAAHGDTKGKPEFPEYGVVQLHPSYVNHDKFMENKYFDYFSDFSMEDVPISVSYDGDKLTYLSKYKDYLVNKGYNVNNVDLLSFRDIYDIVLKLSGKELSYKEWFDKDWTESSGNLNPDASYYIIDNIKSHLPEGNDWLFNTTYWLKSSTSLLVETGPDSFEYDLDPDYMLFIDALGNICMQRACQIALGAGVRPVIEINKTDIIYNITGETDGNGTIDVPKTAEEGEIITYKVEANEGYELDEIVIITTKTNKNIEITDDDVICDENKVCTIKSDKFTMPAEDIIIRVKFNTILVNPKTGDVGITGILFIMMIIFISGIFVLKSYGRGFQL